MPYITTTDNVNLYFEETGSGTPILFIHEMAGDHRSWEPQIRYLSRFYRCIVFNARGYYPSDIPKNVKAYSQKTAANDALAILDGLKLQQAHIVGLSMGSSATLQFGIDHESRALSLTIMGCGSGSDPDMLENNRTRYRAMAQNILDGHYQGFVAEYSSGPYRQPFLKKDPRGWEEFRNRLMTHNPTGKANTLLGVQAERPSLYELETHIEKIKLPTLIMVGDLDEPCVPASIFLQKAIKNSGLYVLPKTGHTINLEEPMQVNYQLHQFLTAVEKDQW